MHVVSMNRLFGVPALTSPNRLKAGLQTGGVLTDRFMVRMHAKNERSLSMNRPVAQASRLRVAAASRRQHEHRAGRPVNSQARPPALHPQGSAWSQCMRKNEWRLSMNLSPINPPLTPPRRGTGQQAGIPSWEGLGALPLN